MLPTLNYLSFDHSEGADDVGCLEAMASVSAAQLPALQAELAALLAWCHADAGPPGPLEDGAVWDFSLSGSQERHRAEAWQFDAARRTFALQPQGPEALRHTVTLTLTASAPWCDALVAAWSLDGD